MKTRKTPRRSRTAAGGAAGAAQAPAQGEGIVSANRAGFGFVRVEGMVDSVFLPPGEMAGLMHGDRVRIRIQRDSQDRFNGQVLEVLERGVQAFLGTVEGSGRMRRVRSADARLGLNCVLEAGATPAGPVEEGDWVIARVVRYPQDGREPVARIERRLDPERPIQMASEAAIARYGLAVDFPDAVLREAHAWGKQVDPAEAATRADLRGLPLVTIDGEDAKDFDDAVYAQTLPDGDFRLIVAIADVSHYVRPGTALDDEALRRGTSVYFPTRVLPMLPTALSNHLCSLEPDVDRLCMVADMRITARGSLGNARFYPAVMRSAARLTYTRAQELLFERESTARAQLGEPLVTALEPLVAVYRALLAARRRRGALDFDAPEAEFVIEGGERVSAIEFSTRNDAHKLIEECMVVANVAAARELREQRVPALYRVHAPPDQRKLDQLATTLRILGIELTLPDEIRTRDLAAIAAQVRDPHARPFIDSLVVRSLAQALYQPENIGHFGLALKDYAHFTSPIRRYPDLMVHRALRARLGLLPRETQPQEEALAGLGAELSRLEKRADEADRYVGTFLKCVYLRDRVGQSFDGLVTTVVEFGCFVQLLDFGVDGLLHLSAMRDDEYVMARNGGQWLGAGGKRSFGPGERVRVVVSGVKPVEGMIDLELATD